MIFLIGNIYAVDILKVTVTYTANGVTKSEDALAGENKTINRDKGTPLSIRIYKTTTAPSPSDFVLACFPTGGSYFQSSTSASYLFSNVGDALTNEIWCTVNTNEGLIRIRPVDLPTLYPDLSPVNREVGGSTSSSYKEFIVGQTVVVECDIWNNGQGEAEAHRTGFYLGTSTSDYSNRFSYKTTGSTPIQPTYAEHVSTTYTFTASDIGSRYFNFWADYQDIIEEGTAEGNNKSSWGPFTIKEVPLSVDVTQPSTNLNITQGQPVTITWTGSGTGAASVSLRRDNDNIWENGTGESWIVIGQPTTGSYVWDTKDVQTGSYNIAAAIFNTTTYSYDYAAGKVTINPLQNVEYFQQEWATLSRYSDVYKIYLVVGNEIPNIASIPLIESRDATNLKHIYITKNNSVLQSNDSYELLLKAQSTKKYLNNTSYYLTDLRNIVNMSDIEPVTRDPFLTSDEYSVYLPYAASGVLEAFLYMEHLILEGWIIPAFGQIDILQYFLIACFSLILRMKWMMQAI